MKERLRVVRLALLDLRDVVTRRRAPMTPSRVRVHAIGGGDFAAVGEHLAQILIDAGRLQPHERVLDVGCGVGRVAVPLTRYLSRGEYTGFDVSRRAIEWCRRAISTRHSNFYFNAVDVYSSHYNERGRIDPAAFTFPCASDSIDVAFLGSILTHLLPNAAAQYVAETARVLKPGGRAVMTFFLLDEAVRERCNLLTPAFTTFPEPWWAIQDAQDPEAAVAYDIDVVRNALDAHGLAITELSRGSWSGAAESRTWQDLIVATKGEVR